VIDLTIEHLKRLIVLPTTGPVTLDTLERSYFSPGSAAYCLLENGHPVFAAGIVNLSWNRGEAWIIPTPFFHSHVKTCFTVIGKQLVSIAKEHKFRRVQVVCGVTQPDTLFKHLGFAYEGTLEAFGPFGERCRMYSRIFKT